MSSLYSKNYIHSYNKQEMLDILDGKNTFTDNPTDSRYRRRYVTLQHFLIQYIERHGKTKVAKEILSKFYQDFKQYPYLFVDSPLINTSFINRYVSLKERKEVLKRKDEYFNEKDNADLSNNILRNNILNNNQKNKLYAYLIKLLRDNNEQNNELLEKHAKIILNSNKKLNELTEMEAKFYCLYIAKRAGQGVVTPDLHFIATDPKLGGTQIHQIIYINKNAACTQELWELTKVICHETRHAYQEKKAHNQVSRTSFEMARHLLFIKYLKSDKYDVYHVNYKYTDIELDAESHALFYSEVLLQTLGRDDLAKRVSKLNTITYNKRHFYEIMYNEKGTAISPDAYTVDYLDRIIQEHPEELNNYPVLQNIYNKDGSKKPLANLIARKINENLDDKGIYDNYINYAILKNRLFEIDLANTKAEIDDKLLKSLGRIYRDKVILFKDYCSDTQYKEIEDSKQITLTTLYEMQIIDNIINFIDHNIEFLLNCREDNRLMTSSFIYNYIHDLSGFDIDKINNEVIKNDPLIRKRVDNLLKKHNSVVKKINDQFIKDRIDDLSIEQLHAIINTPENTKMQLTDYLYYDLLPRVDAHSEVDINGQKTQLAVIINYCRSQVEEKDKTKQIIQ